VLSSGRDWLLEPSEIAGAAQHSHIHLLILLLLLL
jgi:hypothetical protein